MQPIKIAIIVGSLRKESINKRLASAIEVMLPSDCMASRVEIGGLPLYNQDFDADFPTAASQFKQHIESADAIIFITPEYNRSIPGVLKNAIDVGSRPSGKNSFTNKPAAVLGTSPGAAGSALAQQHLRNVLVGVGAVVMPQPEVAIQFKGELIDADGKVSVERTQLFLQGFVDRYVAWVKQQRALLG